MVAGLAGTPQFGTQPVIGAAGLSVARPVAHRIRDDASAAVTEYTVTALTLPADDDASAVPVGSGAAAAPLHV